MIYKYGKFSNLTILMILLMSAILCSSRSFIISTIAATCFLFFDNRDKPFKRGYLYAFLLLVFIALVCFFKTDSSHGRLLIYKISARMLADNPVFGIGNGNFAVNYGIYQANYFASNKYSQKEFLLADDVFFAFNDYWQFIIENGILGVMLLALGLYHLKRIISVKMYLEPSNHFLKLIVALTITILLAACFTHIFDKAYIQFILVLILCYLVIPQSNAKLQIITISFFLVSYLIVQNFNLFHHYRYYKQFENAKTLYSIGYIKESQKVCDQIYPVLKDDVIFLKFYCTNFASHNKALGIKILKHTLTLRTDHVLYLQLAQSLDRINMVKEAETAYLLAVNMVPNRFRSKKLLFDFYKKHKNSTQMNIWGDIILTMPIKIPSETIKTIRTEVRQSISSNKHKIIIPSQLSHEQKVNENFTRHSQSDFISHHLFLPKGSIGNSK